MTHLSSVSEILTFSIQGLNLAVCSLTEPDNSRILLYYMLYAYCRSDFVELRKVLVKRFPQLGKSIPKLPPKRICGKVSAV